MDCMHIRHHYNNIQVFITPKLSHGLDYYIIIVAQGNNNFDEGRE
jgi:hypothetical protein